MDNQRVAKGLVKIAKSILASEKKADTGESIIHFDIHDFFKMNGRMFEVEEWEPLADAIQQAAYKNMRAMTDLVRKTLKRDKAVVELIKNMPDANFIK